MYIPSSTSPGFEYFISRYNTRGGYEASMNRIKDRTNSLAGNNNSPDLADVVSKQSGVGRIVDIRI